MSTAEQAVEREFPGVRCNNVWIYADSLSISVTATAADLLRHGLILPVMIELPPCGSRHFPSKLRPELPADFHATVHRSGSGRFRVHRWWHNDDAKRMRARFGLSPPLPRVVVRLDPEHITLH